MNSPLRRSKNCATFRGRAMKILHAAPGERTIVICMTVPDSIHLSPLPLSRLAWASTRGWRFSYRRVASRPRSTLSSGSGRRYLRVQRRFLHELLKWRRVGFYAKHL